MATGVVPITLEHRLSMTPASGNAKETYWGLKVAYPRGIFPGTSNPPRCAPIGAAGVAIWAFRPAVHHQEGAKSAASPIPSDESLQDYSRLKIHSAAVGLPLRHGGGYPSSQRRLWSLITVNWYRQLA